MSSGVLKDLRMRTKFPRLYTIHDSCVSMGKSRFFAETKVRNNSFLLEPRLILTSYKLKVKKNKINSSKLYLRFKEENI